MSSLVLLNLLIVLKKNDKMRDMLSIVSVFFSQQV